MQSVKSSRLVPQLRGTIKHKGQIRRSFAGCVRIIKTDGNLRHRSCKVVKKWFCALIFDTKGCGE